MFKRLTAVVSELKHHAPFTVFGALTGIVCMLIFKNVSAETNHKLFQIFHPGHVLLSAIVTASLFRLHAKKTSFIAVLLVGYFGSIGIATLSDSVLPFFGETMLGVAVPTHHHHDADEHQNQPKQTEQSQHLANNNDPVQAEHTQTEHIQAEHIQAVHKQDEHKHADKPLMHLGFIEDWYIVNPAAIIGIILAFFWPRTKLPHAGHVLISTWASSFHVLMNTHKDLSASVMIGIFAVLFIAVWLPCCISDIVFPMLFVRTKTAQQTDSPDKKSCHCH